MSLDSNYKSFCPFKDGDKVKCIYPHKLLLIDQIYTIKKVYLNINSYPMVIIDGIDNRSWDAIRFEKVSGRRREG